MLANGVDIIKWLQKCSPIGEFHLSDGRWFVSNGIDSREIAAEEIAAMYFSSLVPRKVDLPDAYGLLQEMANAWGVSVEWLQESRRSKNRPVMRAIFFFIARHRFPKAARRQLGQICGVLDHTTVRKGQRNISRWLSVRDPSVMKYYEPVAHLYEPANLVTH